MRLTKLVTLIVIILSFTTACSDSTSGIFRSGNTFPQSFNGAAAFTQRQYATQSSQGYGMGWTYDPSSNKLDEANFTLSDSTGKIVYKSPITLSLLSTSGVRSQTIPVNLPEGYYTAVISIYDAYRNEARDTATFIVDRTPPSVKLYLGTEDSTDTCANPPTPRSVVALRLSPYALCIKDLGLAPAGVSHVCMLPEGSGSTAPAANSGCWTKIEELTKLVLLRDDAGVPNAINHVSVFARDAAGNVSPVDSGTIKLNAGKPPVINIVGPTPAQIISKKWAAGEQYDFVYKVADDDTAFDKLKYIVSLVDAADPTNFKYLACNFANTALWKQCPLTSIENSPLITKISSDTMKFRFTVPSDWDQSKKYLLTVTAIDEAGNAAVSSTQEINAGFEVLAGRTYKGKGSSPERLARVEATLRIASDKHGSVYDITNNLKTSSFDHRTCRMVRKITESPQIMDCPDIIVTDYTIASGLPWSYNSDKDVFYAVTVDRKSLVEIDFNSKTAKVVVGGGGTALNASLPIETLGTSIDTSNGLWVYMYYEPSIRRLYFRAKGQFYSLDDLGKVRYVMGTLGGTLNPANQNGMQKDIVFPDVDHAFGITRDHRILISGDKLPATPSGSNMGIHYMLDGFSENDPNKIANFFMITPGNGVYNPGSDIFSQMSLTSIFFDAPKNEFIAAGSYHGIAKIALPAVGASATQYNWVPFFIYTSTGTFDEDAFVAGTDPGLTVRPFSSTMQTMDITLIASNYIYFNNRFTNNIIGMETTNGIASRAFGFGFRDSIDELGQNRYLDTPTSLGLTADGDLIFNDLYSLHKLTGIASGNVQATTLSSQFKQHVFRIDADRNQLIQLVNKDIRVYSLSDFSQYGALVLPGGGSSYDSLYGLSNNLSNMKNIYIGNLYNKNYVDPVSGKTVGAVDKTYISLGQFGDLSTYATNQTYTASTRPILSSAVLSKTDTFSIGVQGASYCKDSGGNVVACAQGTLLSDSGYASNDLRLTASNPTKITDRGKVTLAAFDGADQYVISCLENKFAIYSIALNRFFLVNGVDSAGAALSCKTTVSTTNHTLFKYQNGEIYFTIGKEFYKMTNTMAGAISEKLTRWTKVSTGELSNGPLGYGDFIMKNGYIYYTDQAAHRVVRTPYTP